MLIEVLDAKLSLGLSRAKRGRQIEATLGWVLSCPAGRGMETRATQCRPRVVPAQTSSNLSHPPGFGYFPTNALEGEREHKEVDFFSPILFLKPVWAGRSCRSVLRLCIPAAADNQPTEKGPVRPLPRGPAWCFLDVCVLSALEK